MASKPSMRFIATTSDKLETIELKAGQLIFCQDTRAIYLDTDKRVSYQQIITVVDEETRESLPSPVNGFYYVRKNNTLWSYFDSTWTQITGQDSSLIFADEELPSEGEENKIYVNDIKMYRWNKEKESYDLMAGGSELNWENLAE